MLITEEEQITMFYEALIERKESFVGIFFVAVKTTSVFCIATCRARKPKLKNVLFYTSFREALANGYRPCKICRPTENANQAPEQVEKAIQLVKNNPKVKITDQQLREEQISPETVRRWFNKHYGMTFQAYQRMYRVNTAYQELQQGKKVTHAAFDTGYESLSGFGYTFKKLIGKSPAASIGKRLILISRFTSPLGPMFIGATDKGICLVEFTDRRMLETAFQDLQRLLDARIIVGENNYIKQAKEELRAYFEGKLMTFSVDLETPGTAFQQLAWKGLQKLAYAEIVSYQEQAKRVDREKAVRAIGTANGANRVAIIIPCHRVIGKNGQLTGYGGGIERKRWLLDHEQKHLLE